MGKSVVAILDERKAKFLASQILSPVEERLICLKEGIPYHELIEWQADDPDFAVACVQAQECALDLIEQSVYAQATTGGDGRLGLDILKALRPEKFSPNLDDAEREVEHRFFDFGGDDLHSPKDDEEVEVRL